MPRTVIVENWLAATLRTYPEQTSRFLLATGDPFRNPVGRALKEGLPVLFDELAGDFDRARIEPVLDEILHIRAVQDFTPSQAVGFLFFLKPILRETLEPEAADRLDRRVDEMSLLAFDLYMRCREKMCEIKVNEAKRRIFLLERTAGVL